MLAPTRLSLKCSGPRLIPLVNAFVTPSKCHRPYATTTASSSSGLRHGPWQFTPDSSFQQTRKQTALQRNNLEIGKAVQSDRVINAFELAADMKAKGVQPDITTYTYLMDGVSKQALSVEAWAILEDMLAVGVKPDQIIFDYLIHAQRLRISSYLWRCIDAMEQCGVEPSTRTFTYILARFANDDNLEMCLKYLKIMSDKQIFPNVEATQNVINLACRVGYPRLALDLAEQFEVQSVRRLDHEVWMNCLASSSEALYIDGTTHCWTVVTKELNVTPDEGLCIRILHTAARHGLPDLAADVISRLKATGVELDEHHFVPLVEAFCTAGRVKDAILTLGIIRNSNINIFNKTASPIVKAASQNIDVIDTIWTNIEEIHKEGHFIDVGAANAIIEACSNIGDMQRAIGFFKSFSELGLQPDQNTFELLLHGCVVSRHRDLGDRLLSDMKEAKIKPEAKTFENMTLLCLTQDTYEDAFFYLEETKGAGFLPTYNVYEALALKCAENSDPRLSLVLDEMRQNKLTSSNKLRLALGAGKPGRISADPNADVTDAPQIALDGAARRFIETGGLIDSIARDHTRNK